MVNESIILEIVEDDRVELRTGAGIVAQVAEGIIEDDVEDRLDLVSSRDRFLPVFEPEYGGKLPRALNRSREKPGHTEK